VSCLGRARLGGLGTGWTSTLGQTARQCQIAKLVEIEDVAREAHRPLFDLRRLAGPVPGQVLGDFGFECRDIAVEGIEQRDPTVILLEPRSRRQRCQEVCIDGAPNEALRPTLYPRGRTHWRPSTFR
jgi:hypothetical protein